MNLDIDSLRCFVMAASCLNFTKAAELLFSTQSTVSRRIAQIEKDMGVELFERTGPGLRLTGAGDTVYGQTAAQMKLVTTAPYYAMKVGVSVLGTMASLKCDEQCRILNNAGEAIENLYGAGEVIFGNLFVQEYVASGCAMGCAVYTGAIAAQDALSAIGK